MKIKFRKYIYATAEMKEPIELNDEFARKVNQELSFYRDEFGNRVEVSLEFLEKFFTYHVPCDEDIEVHRIGEEKYSKPITIVIENFVVQMYWDWDPVANIIDYDIEDAGFSAVYE